MPGGPKGSTRRSEGVMGVRTSFNHPHVTFFTPAAGAHAIAMGLPFDRTRRWLLGRPDTRIPGPTPDAPVDGTPHDAPDLAGDTVLTIGRTEVDQLGIALQALLGPGTARPDTPARLEAALASAVERLGGVGRPRVTRRPPGLYTPEAWQVRLTRTDPAIGEAIRSAARGLGFSL